MKKSLYFIVFFLTLFNSCSDDSSIPVESEDVTANIEGDVFKSGFYHLITRTDTETGSTVLQLGAYEDNGNGIIFVLYDFHGVGKYTLNNSICCDYISYVNGSIGFDYSTHHLGCDGSGEINITYADENKVEGTFFFTGKGLNDCDVSKSITDGNFSCKYQTTN